MKVKRLKELIKNLDDDAEIFIRNSVNPLGNISDLCQVELSLCSFFGKETKCIIMNSGNSKRIEEDEEENYKEFIDTIHCIGCNEFKNGVCTNIGLNGNIVCWMDPAEGEY